MKYARQPSRQFGFVSLLLAAALLLPASLRAQTPATFANSEPAQENTDKRFSQRSASFLSVSKAATSMVLAPLAAAELALAEKGQALNPQAQRVAVTRDLSAMKRNINLRDLPWQTAPNGNWVSKLQLTSPQAYGLRLEFSNITDAAARNVSVRLQGNALQTIIEGPQSLGSNAQAEQWSAWTAGDTVTIEFELAKQFKPADLSLAIGKVSHFDKNMNKSQECDRDVACEPVNSAMEFVSRSAARILFQDVDGGYTCSGTLLTDLDPNSQIAHFLTAEHCISNAFIANTITTKWFYQNSTCGGTQLDQRYLQINGGAEVQSIHPDTDMTLLRMRGGFSPYAVLAGWSVEPLSAIDLPVVGIHHPNGLPKKISNGTTYGFRTWFGSIDRTHIGVTYTQNSPTSGSSGSALFATSSTGVVYLRGTLSGGTTRTAACTALKAYGRLDLSTRITNTLRGLLAIAPYVPYVDPAAVTGWWWDAKAGGQGFGIEVREGKLFIGGFLYDLSGRPIWFISNGKMYSDSAYNGAMIQYSGGQSLNGAYVKPSNPVTPGNLSLFFLSNTSLVMSWPGGTKVLSRFPIVPNGVAVGANTGMPERGWYTGPGEDGRGWMLEVQGDTLFMAGFMYDATGYPIWYLSTGKMTSSRFYSGNWSTYGNGQTYTGNYLSPTVSNSAVGNVTVFFDSPRTANLTLPNGRIISLVRFTNF